MEGSAPDQAAVSEPHGLAQEDVGLEDKEYGGEEDFGLRVPLKVADPKLPSAEEVEAHNLTHLPYRSWCPHCVRGKGKTMDHRRASREKIVRELHVDYCFMSARGDESTKCIVVAKDYDSKSVMASVVPVKGSSREFPARRIIAFIRELGLEGQDIVLRSDQEPALQDLLRDVGKRRVPAKTFYEVSPVGSSASNGVAERGVQTVEGQIRVLKDALEARLGARVPSDHNVLAWLVEFAGTVVNRYEVGRDGKTPHERLRGKASRLIGLEFGEKVNFRRTAIGTRMAKLDSLWSDGVFLGYRSVSGEIVVGTQDGVFKTRTVRRKAFEHRWQRDNLDMVGGVPWRTAPAEDEEQDVMPAVDIRMELPDVEVPRPPEGETRPIPRRLYIRTQDIERHGATVNCKGCVATLRGQRGIPHTEACRKRLTDEIEQCDEGDRVKCARRREIEFYEHALQAKDQEMKRKAGGEEDAGAKRKRSGEDTGGASGSGLVRAGGPAVRAEMRGAKRSAEDPPADESRGDPAGGGIVGEKDQDAEMGYVGFQAYDEDGGLWMVACKEPEEDVEEALQDGPPWVNDPGLADAAAFRDDRTGKPLDAKKVRAAREEELQELDRRVWQEADVNECWEKKGRGPIGVRWVDVDKGFGVHRSRLVAKDFRPKSRVGDREDLFAATPPLELVKMTIAKAARSPRGSKGARKVMFIDISKAHLYAPMLEEDFVEYPPERHKEGKCARLLNTLYGMRSAASNWEKEYSATLEEKAFRPGQATAVAFYNEERDVRIVVHGDDLVIEGFDPDIEWVRDVLAAKYLIKVRGVLGPDAEDQKSIVILGRVLEWREEELWWEADPRHVERILEACGVSEGNSSVVPGVRLQEEVGDEEGLEGEELTRFCSVAARANFLAQDRPDIRYAVKELCRDMAKPTRASWRKMKKLARYLKGQPRMVQKIKLGAEGMGDEVKVIVDSGWAGCSSTRRSTNGGCIMVGDVCFKSWSTTQRVVALSSGEAEYYAAVKGASEGLGFIAGCVDLGIWKPGGVTIKVLTDSSACKGICQRTGLGRVRHIDVALLWLQDMVRRGRISMRKVPGKENPADVFTKYLAGARIAEVSNSLGFYVQGGRSIVVDAA